MDKSIKSKLEEAGWKIGDAASFLGLSPEEEAYVEQKLALSKAVHEQRKRLRLTQT